MVTTRFETLLDVGLIALALQLNHHGARQDVCLSMLPC